MMFLVVMLSIPVDRVDMVELNHFYGRSGNHVFDQVVWWDWNEQQCRFDVVAWRLLKNVRREDIGQRRQWERQHHDGPPYVPEFIGGHATPERIGDRWVSDWRDEKTGRRRVVSAAQFRESWTDWDVELVQREILPEARRRGLSR